MTHTIPVSKENYYKAVLITISPYIGNLTDYEVNFLTAMLKHKIKALGTEDRKALLEILDTDIYTLNNYIKRLKDKGTIIESSGGLIINPALINNIDDKQITIKFNVS
jgi:hypothetical protein